MRSDDSYGRWQARDYRVQWPLLNDITQNAPRTPHPSRCGRQKCAHSVPMKNVRKYIYYTHMRQKAASKMMTTNGPKRQRSGENKLELCRKPIELVCNASMRLLRITKTSRLTVIWPQRSSSSCALRSMCICTSSELCRPSYIVTK